MDTVINLDKDSVPTLSCDEIILMAIAYLISKKTPLESKKRVLVQIEQTAETAEKTVCVPTFKHGTSFLKLIMGKMNFVSYSDAFIPFTLTLPLKWEGSLWGFHEATCAQTEKQLERKAFTNHITPSTISKKYFTEPKNVEYYKSDSLQHLRNFFLSGVEITVEEFVKAFGKEVVTEMPFPFFNLVDLNENSENHFDLSKPTDKTNALKLYEDFSFEHVAVEQVDFKKVKSTFPIRLGLKSNFVHLDDFYDIRSLYEMALTSFGPNATTADVKTYEHKFPTNYGPEAALINPTWISKVEYALSSFYELLEIEDTAESDESGVKYKFFLEDKKMAALNGLVAIKYLKTTNFIIIPTNHWLNMFLIRVTKHIQTQLNVLNKEIPADNVALNELIKQTCNKFWLVDFLNQNPTFSIKAFQKINLVQEKPLAESTKKENEDLDSIIGNVTKEHLQEVAYDIFVKDSDQVKMLLKLFLAYAQSFYKSNKSISVETLGFLIYRMDEAYVDNTFKIQNPWICDKDLTKENSKKFLTDEYSLEMEVVVKCKVFSTINNQKDYIYIVPDEFYQSKLY